MYIQTHAGFQAVLSSPCFIPILTKIGIYRLIQLKIYNNRFYKNPFIIFKLLIAYSRTEGQKLVDEYLQCPISKSQTTLTQNTRTIVETLNLCKEDRNSFRFQNSSITFALTYIC
jgi:hypothetical protein